MARCPKAGYPEPAPIRSEDFVSPNGGFQAFALRARMSELGSEADIAH